METERVQKLEVRKKIMLTADKTQEALICGVGVMIMLIVFFVMNEWSAKFTVGMTLVLWYRYRRRWSGIE